MMPERMGNQLSMGAGLREIRFDLGHSIAHDFLVAINEALAAAEDGVPEVKRSPVQFRPG